MRTALFSLALAAAFTAGAHPCAALADDTATQLSVGTESDGDPAPRIPRPCGQGSRIECGSITTQTCINWIPQYNFTIGPSGGGGGYTLVCGTWVTKFEKLYKDP